MSELSVDPRCEADLRWFWCWSDGELGLRSSFGPMVNRLQVGGRTGGSPIVDVDGRAIEAATKARRISRALELLCPIHRRVLFSVFGPTAPVVPLPVLGAAAPVAPLLEVASRAHKESRTTRPIEDWLLRLAWRVHRRSSTSCDRAIALEISAAANDALCRSVCAFSSAMRASVVKGRRTWVNE